MVVTSKDDHLLANDYYLSFWYRSIDAGWANKISIRPDAASLFASQLVNGPAMLTATSTDPNDTQSSNRSASSPFSLIDGKGQ